MISLLLTIFRRKNAVSRATIANAIAVVFTFISSILLLFLALACLNPHASFSQIYLVKIQDGSAEVRSGYYKLCGTSSNSTQTTCGRPDRFTATKEAYDFVEHVSRPYFITMAVVVAWLSFLSTAFYVVVPRGQSYIMAIWTSAATLALACIAAIWQQVAVQAALVLLPKSVRRGHRASGLVWSAVSLLALAVPALMLGKRPNGLSADQSSLDSGDTSDTLDKYSISSPMH